MNVTREDPVSHREARRCLDRAEDTSERAVARRSRRRSSGARRRGCETRLELPRFEQARLDENGLERAEPPPVVSDAEVGGRLEALDRMPEGIDVAPSRPHHLEDHPEHPALPRRVEEGLVRLDGHAAE